MAKTQHPECKKEDLADIKTISEKLEVLPRDKLMYVAGAVTALAASSEPKKDRKDSA